MYIYRPSLTLFESTRRRTAVCCVKAWLGSLTDAPTQGKSIFIITLTDNDHNSQCFGSASGSLGSVPVFQSPGSASGPLIYLYISGYGSPYIKQKNEEKLWFLLFCDFCMTFYLWRMKCCFRLIHTAFVRVLSFFLWKHTREWSDLELLTEHKVRRLGCKKGNCTGTDTEISTFNSVIQVLWGSGQSHWHHEDPAEIEDGRVHQHGRAQGWLRAHGQ